MNRDLATLLNLQNFLEQVGIQKTVSEQSEGGWGFNASDTGNYDDTRSDGINDGRIELARELLDKFFSVSQTEIQQRLKQ